MPSGQHILTCPKAHVRMLHEIIVYFIYLHIIQAHIIYLWPFKSIIYADFL